jgi:hypothetical protein
MDGRVFATDGRRLHRTAKAPRLAALMQVRHIARTNDGVFGAFTVMQY